MSNCESLIEIVVNGEPQTVEAGLTIAGLADSLGLAGRYAVEVDGRIVPRSEHVGHVLAAGARVEIVAAIGGGSG